MNPTVALPPGIVFAQPLTPVAGSLLLSFLVAVIPIAVALIALGVLRRPAWQASLAGLVAGLAVAIGAWGCRPVSRSMRSAPGWRSPSCP